MAAANINAVQLFAPFEWTKDTTLNDFNRFRVRFEAHCVNNNLVINNANHQGALRRFLVLYAGDWFVDKMFLLPNWQNQDCNGIMEGVAAYFAQPNVRIAELHFTTCMPHANESIVDYVGRLKQLARLANMDNVDELRRVIMRNHYDSKTRMKCLEMDDFQQFIDWRTAKERTESIQQLIDPHVATADAQVTRVSTWQHGRGGRQLGQPKHQQQSQYRCMKCGLYTIHGPTGCPADNAQCRSCHNWGHYQNMCKIRQNAKRDIRNNTSNTSYSFRGYTTVWYEMLVSLK